MVCSQALRPSLQTNQKRYSVGDGSLILHYSGEVTGIRPVRYRWLEGAPIRVGAPPVLVPPEPRKPSRRQRRIPRHRLQVPMPEVMRQRPSIMADVRELVTSAMPPRWLLLLGVRESRFIIAGRKTKI